MDRFLVMIKASQLDGLILFWCFRSAANLKMEAEFVHSVLVFCQVNSTLFILHPLELARLLA